MIQSTILFILFAEMLPIFAGAQIMSESQIQGSIVGLVRLVVGGLSVITIITVVFLIIRGAIINYRKRADGELKKYRRERIWKPVRIGIYILIILLVTFQIFATTYNNVDRQKELYRIDSRPNNYLPEDRKIKSRGYTI